MTRKLTAGGPIEARCTRCREVLNHTIVAMIGEQVVKVECNTCHGVHNYRGADAKKKPETLTPVKKRAPSTASARKDPGAAEREEWEALRQGIEAQKSLAYEMSGSYRLNSVVEHPVFGRGVVKLLINPSKMEVLFQGGKKLLRCR